MKIILLTSRPWNLPIVQEIEQELDAKVLVINRKEDLNTENLKNFAPDWIFVPHWSHIIPDSIHQNFKVVIFHMTDLPYGRGGSPLQNLIVKGHKKTKISALACSTGVDDGPIYLKADLDLAGSAQEIFLRARSVITNMILVIARTNPKPTPQQGEIVEFKRRKPSEGNLLEVQGLEKIYDYIRMLDCEGYPNSFILGNDWIATFQEASFNGKEVTAKVTFKKRNEE